MQPLENTGVRLWTRLRSSRVCREERERENHKQKPEPLTVTINSHAKPNQGQMFGEGQMSGHLG